MTSKDARVWWMVRLLLFCMIDMVRTETRASMRRQADAIFKENGLEYRRERVGKGIPAAQRGGDADCGPDGIESDAVRIHL